MVDVDMDVAVKITNIRHTCCPTSVGLEQTLSKDRE